MGGGKRFQLDIWNCLKVGDIESVANLDSGVWSRPGDVEIDLRLEAIDDIGNDLGLLKS